MRLWCDLPGFCYLSVIFLKEVEPLIENTLNFSCHLCFGFNFSSIFQENKAPYIFYNPINVMCMSKTQRPGKSEQEKLSTRSGFQQITTSVSDPYRNRLSSESRRVKSFYAEIQSSERWTLTLEPEQNQKSVEMKKVKLNLHQSLTANTAPAAGQRIENYWATWYADVTNVM